MIHFREDYNRIQDPEGNIGEDEPVILFRAQDRFFIAVVCFYIILMVIRGFNQHGVNKIVKHCIDGLRLTYSWYERNWNKVKSPDI